VEDRATRGCRGRAKERACSNGPDSRLINKGWGQRLSKGMPIQKGKMTARGKGTKKSLLLSAFQARKGQKHQFSAERSFLIRKTIVNAGGEGGGGATSQEAATPSASLMEGTADRPAS